MSETQAEPIPAQAVRSMQRPAMQPAMLALIGAGLVLVLVLLLFWLMPSRGGGDAARVQALEARILTMEAAPRTGGGGAVNLGPIEQRLTTLETRLGAIEQRAVADPRQQESLAGRVAAIEPRVAEIMGRPVPDAATLAQMVARTDRLFERMDAQAARLQATETEAARRAEEVARIAGERLAAAQQTLQQSIAGLQRIETGRIEALEAAMTRRLTALEQGQQRLAALEERARRMGAYDALAARLAGGQPLGPALGGMQDPPVALARFATVAPPTESALRLSFEDAARAARAASEPAREGQGVADTMLARLSGLITVRRGEEVVWGDAAAAEIEGARRALEAGDLDGALARLARLPVAGREAMRPWTEQASALSAARAAIRALAAG